MATKIDQAQASGFTEAGDVSRRAIIGDQYVDGMLKAKNARKTGNLLHKID